MAIQQTIQYNSNNTYFAGFLQDIINGSSIKAGLVQKDKRIFLNIDDSDKEALLIFGDNITNYLPHSIFLGDITTLRKDIDVYSSNFKSDTYNISLCTRCLEKLTNPASENYLDDSIICEHYTNTQYSNYVDITNYSPHYSDGDKLLIADTSKIHELFVLTEDEIKALLSIEKPTIKVTIKDEILKKLTGKKFINIKSPYSMRSTLVALNAKDGNVPYLFFKSDKDLTVSLIQKDLMIIKDTIGISQEIEELDSNNVISRFLNISKEAGFVGSSIGVNLSVEHGISFMVSNRVEVKIVLSFQEFRLSNIMFEMQKDEKKQKLLLNFEKKYPKILKELNESGEYNLYETLATVFELESKTYETLSDKSLEFHGNGGLKIDTFFNEDGFDYVSFLGSIMSFKLAGTDEHYLAYSTFEALGDMTISTLNQLKTKYKISNFVMMGSMFENSVLHSRILSKFAMGNPYFSKSFALDD